jgi:hypothetical protein
MIFAGIHPTILYGSTSFVTTFHRAITAPFPIVTPLIIVTFLQIHTSLPTITSQFDVAHSFLEGHSVITENGYVEIRSAL